MTKSELVDSLTMRFGRLPRKDVEVSVHLILELMTKTLAANERIEIRGFGSFVNRIRPARIGRNPKTGEAVQIKESKHPHFKPGKVMRDNGKASMGNS